VDAAKASQFARAAHRIVVVAAQSAATANRKTMRSEPSAVEASTVDMNGSVVAMKRGRIAGTLVDRSISATDRTIDRKCTTGKEARRG
jgi:hypothetical protein